MRTSIALILISLVLNIPGAAQENTPFQAPIAAQVYKDPTGRFGFSAPAGWARIADQNPDEVTFQNKRGDNLRVTLAPLKVPEKAFLDVYVDTYLEVLAQSFSDVKFMGQRDTRVGGREAHDFTFTGVLGTTPVTCRQIIVFGKETIIYATFAGFGLHREASEQLFNLAMMTMWVDAEFGGRTAVSAPDRDVEWPFDFQIPGGWIEYRAPAEGTRVFRPANAREMSAMVTAFINTPSAGLPTTIDDAFVKTYSERVCGYYAPSPCRIRTSTGTKLGGETAVRLDYVFAADTNARRVSLVLAMHNGQLVGVACEAAESAYNSYTGAFEAVFATFKFR